MTAETQTFERAAAFRSRLAAYLGLPAGKDPEGVGITLGPTDEPVIGMPLSVAERLLADAQAEHEFRQIEGCLVDPAERRPGRTYERVQEVLAELRALATPGEPVPEGPRADDSPPELRARVESVGRALLDRIGREVTILRYPPVGATTGVYVVTGVVERLVEPGGDEPPYVMIATDDQGSVTLLLRDVVEIKAWSA